MTIVISNWQISPVINQRLKISNGIEIVNDIPTSFSTLLLNSSMIFSLIVIELAR